MFRLAELFVEIGTNGRPLQQGLEMARVQVKSMADTLARDGGTWFTPALGGVRDWNAALARTSGLLDENRAKLTQPVLAALGQNGLLHGLHVSPLMGAFKNEIMQLPEIAGLQFTSLANMIKQETDKSTSDNTKRLENPQAPVKERGNTTENATTHWYEAKPPLQQAQKVETMGLADFAKKLQQSAFGGNLDQQQLAATQQVAANTGRFANRPDPVALAAL